MFSRSRIVHFTVLLLAMLCVAWSEPAFCQVTGSIEGTIEDSGGANLPGAAVTIKNLETGAERRVSTDNSGSYLVLSLPIGHYSVTAAKAGFDPAEAANINLVVGQQAVIDLKLNVGTANQTVIVTEEAPVVDTTPSSTAGLVTEQQVKDLPLDGRSFDQLIALDAGSINYTAYSTAQSTGGGAGNMFNVNGGRYEENLFLINGVEYTGDSVRSVQPGGVSGSMLGVDAVREFNLLTDSFSAQYGKRPAGQVVVVTQSGSNAVHGTAFEFLRNSAVDARNYFDPKPSIIGRRIPGFQRNQFGGAFGGPLHKDRAFGFLNYEGFRQILGVSDVAAVPDNNARQGELPCGFITPLPAGCAGTTDTTPMKVPNLATGMLAFFAIWPQSNGNELGNGVALFAAAPKETIREDFATTRFDQTLRAADTLSESYTFDNGYSFVPQTDPYFAARQILKDQVASIQEVHVIGTAKVNTARFGFSRGSFDFNVPPTVSLSPTLSQIAGLEEGQVTIGGGQTLSSGSTTVAVAGSTTDYDKATRNLYSITDDFQWIIGRHQIGFGGWFQRMQDNRHSGQSIAGTANFSNIETFLQGTVSSFQGAATPTPSYYRMSEGAWYVEDTIKLMPRLSIEAGLRHEMTNILGEKYGRIALGQRSFTTGEPLTTTLTGTPFTKNYDTLLFGPRIGIAWDVFGNQKTAVQVGSGIFYSLPDYYDYIFDRVAPYHTIYTFGTNAAFLPLVGQTSVQGPLCGPGVPTPCSKVSQTEIDSNKASQLQKWNLSIEQQIAPGSSLRVEYSGSHAIHEISNINFDTIPPVICQTAAGCVSGGLNKAQGLVPQGTLYVPPATALPDPYIAAMSGYSGFSASYNALIVDLKSRIGHSLNLRANYTWSKHLDIGAEPGGAEQGNGTTAVEQPYHPSADWGPSSNDCRNVASISESYQLPIGRGTRWLNNLHGIPDHLVSGWSANSIVSLLSGFPFNPKANTNESGDGDNGSPDRPSLNPNFSGPIITHNPVQWYNPNAFMLPTSGTWGNVRKDSLRGPGLNEWDLSMFKDTAIRENLKLQFRAEFFNILNSANFGFPNQSVFSGGAVSPAAGLITTTTTTSREIQFAAKFIF
jgi:hypothetical protein